MVLKTQKYRRWFLLALCAGLYALLRVNGSELSDRSETANVLCGANRQVVCVEDQNVVKPRPTESTSIRRMDWRTLLPAVVRRRSSY
jgi:hypothetical protein